MSLFLLVYNQVTGELVEQVEFADGERATALQARFEQERVHHEDPTIEVVLLSGTREGVEKTHARYFKRADELLTP